MSTALLVEYYRQLPGRHIKEEGGAWRARRDAATNTFRKQVEARYTEGTLLRLLTAAGAESRRAALAALGVVGTMTANQPIAARLHDDDAEARQLAGDALWAIWFRADSDANNRELQRLMRVRDREKALNGFDFLLKKAPDFAEAYNQRAVLTFRLKDYERSAADCERVLELNPLHFGAQAGLGQCYLQMRKNRSALKAFRAALRINPNLDGVAETIRTLENALGEEGRRDDKK